jgi:nucleolar GTP-binding protein
MCACHCQAITALAHLRSAVLYVVDISEQCGHSLQEQLELFNNIKPLFANKPLIVIFNKIDIVRPEDVSDEKKEVLKAFEDESKFCIMYISVSKEENLSNQNVKEVLAAALEQGCMAKIASYLSGP